MEPLSLRVAKIVGTPNQEVWSQVHSFSPQDPEKKEKRGTLLAVLSFSLPDEGVEAAAFGREILSRVHEEYFGDVERGAMEELVQTVSRVSKEFHKGDQSLEIVTAALVNNVLYLAGFGGGAVWVKRGSLEEKILEANSKEVESASGFLKDEDLVVVGTESFFQLAGEGVLRASLENNEPQDTVEVLAPLVQGYESPAVAALIAKAEIVKKNLLEEVQENEVVSSPATKEGFRRQKLENVSRTTEFPVSDKRHFSFGKITSRLSSLLEKMPKVSRKAIYVANHSSSNKNKRVIFAVALVLIGMLGVSLFFGTQKRQLVAKQQQFNQTYEKVKSLIEQGEALSALNPLQSRELLEQAQQKFSELEQLKFELAKTQELKHKIESTISLVVKEYQLNDAPVFFDLTLIASGARADKLSLVNDYLTVLDKSGNKIFGIDIKRKSGEILSGGQLTNAKLTTSNEKLIFVLDESGISNVALKDKKTQKGIIALDSDWGEIVDLKIYGDNLYLLDKKGDSIWRYINVDGNFGAKRNWFGQGVSHDLSLATSFSIDGSVWVLLSNGKILKFSQGVPETFETKSLDKALSNPAVIYTKAETQYLYVLDKGNNRVVVLSKSGEYQSQYLWDGIASVSDMVVSETEKKILLLDGSKIYGIGIK